MKSENQNITLQKKFNKIYLDIFQHSKNTKNWIKHSSRKKGNLNKSIKNLEKKYKELVYIKKRLQNQGFSDKELFSTASKKISLDKYKQLIIDLKKIYTEYFYLVDPQIRIDALEYIQKKMLDEMEPDILVNNELGFDHFIDLIK